MGVPALFDPFPQVASTSPLAPYVPPYPPWFLLFVYKAIDFKFFNLFGAYSPLVDKPEYKKWYPYNLMFMMQLGAFTFGILLFLPSAIDAYIEGTDQVPD